MSLTISDNAANTSLDAIDTLVNSESAAGYVEFQTAGNTNCAAITLNDPAFAAAASRSMSFDTSPVLSNSDATAGTITHMDCFEGDGTNVFTISTSTTTSSGFIRVTSESIGAGDKITITAFTLSATGS